MTSTTDTQLIRKGGKVEKLEATKQVEEIQRMYQEMMGDQVAFSALIAGIQGVGKSTFCCTGRLPILIDVFDPRGTVFIHVHPELKKLYEEKKIIVRPYWNEDSKNPSEYQRWESQWQEDCKSGFLSMFGTYVIDSGTTMIEAMSNYIRKKKARGDNLQVQDYIPLYNTIMDIIKISNSQGCDFLYTGHLLTIQDEVTGEVKAELDTYLRLRSKIPKLFTEKYVLLKEKTSSGPAHVLYTHSTGRYEASSQLAAGGKLPAKVEPNLKALLELVGLPTTDKEITWGG